MTFSRRSFVAASLAAVPVLAQKRAPLVYIGAYTSEMNKGITVARLDLSTGALTDMSLAAEIPNPTFLELHPSGRFLYAINEIGNYEGRKEGSVCAFSVDRASGKLTPLNRVSARGSGPCHISLDKSGRMAMIANYGGGSVASYRIGESGRLSEAVSFVQHEGKSVNPRRQEGPHAHSINPAPDNRYAVACDLGTDEIRIYKINPSKGSMEAHRVVQTAPGAGPRHFAWHPNGVFGYAVNELNSTVTAFHYGDGEMVEIHSVATLPEGFKGENWPAEIRVHPNGRFVYSSNRGENSIAAFKVDAKTGKLEALGNTPTQGVMPRNFFIEPGGRWLLAANQRSNNVIVLEIDPKTGKLLNTGKGITVGQPVCLRTLAGS
ncbi:MAG: lactonase family protein [Acidobacteria bacterium]|nr:lactonase family protein [Acidobacteriota bacterium]